MALVNDGCSYGADPCPKIEDCYRTIARMKDQLNSLTRITYMIAGIVVIEFGVNLF